MVAAIPAVTAGASLIGGLFGKSTSDKVPQPPNYYGPYASQAAGEAFNRIGALPGQDWAATAIPGAQSIWNQAQNNPGAQPAIQGANTAMQMGQQGAQTMYGYGQGESGFGAGMLPYAQQIMNMGLDPQQEMYNRAQHNMTEATRASLAARGLGMSPYGAGVENKAMSDFNIDWSNTALQRAIAGGQGGANVAGAGANMINQGQALAAQAPGSYYQASMYPYQTYTGMGQDQLKALTGATGIVQGAQNLAATPIEAYLRMVSGGQGAANQQYATASTNANNAFNQNQTLGTNIGTGLNQLGKADWSWMQKIGAGSTV